MQQCISNCLPRHNLPKTQHNALHVASRAPGQLAPRSPGEPCLHKGLPSTTVGRGGTPAASSTISIQSCQAQRNQLQVIKPTTVATARCTSCPNLLANQTECRHPSATPPHRQHPTCVAQLRSQCQVIGNALGLHCCGWVAQQLQRRRHIGRDIPPRSLHKGCVTAVHWLCSCCASTELRWHVRHGQQWQAAAGTMTTLAATAH